MGELDVDDYDDNLDDDNFEEGDLEAVSYVCEDCDYRWEESALDEESGGSMVCPMCGSTNVTQL
ncbi:MAG: hypothetical protein KDK30_15725, partial [Leptospiraceae bacterium]|nr:hypothetical protein [Leptospiraceae bacterium]MCB1316381.1 hypothetical protein [Leptospiraceae bacterium]MCB1321178.1 hypothetical protein [Leptospiraceae bacterium]